MADDRHGPREEQPAQIVIPLFGNAPQPFLAPGRGLLGNQPDPGGQFTARLEHRWISDRGGQGARRDGPNAGNSFQAPTDLVRTVPSIYALLGDDDFALQRSQLPSQTFQTDPGQ